MVWNLGRDSGFIPGHWKLEVQSLERRLGCDPDWAQEQLELDLGPRAGRRGQGRTSEVWEKAEVQAGVTDRMRAWEKLGRFPGPCPCNEVAMRCPCWRKQEREKSQGLYFLSALPAG